MKNDLTSRIQELDESIQMHKKAYVHQKNTISILKQDKANLDKKLNYELAAYDSDYLARASDTEQKISTLEEKLRNIEKIKSIYEKIPILKDEADSLVGDITKVERIIQEEINKISPDIHIRKIESTYAYSLKKVNVPEVGSNDFHHNIFEIHGYQLSYQLIINRNGISIV